MKHLCIALVATLLIASSAVTTRAQPALPTATLRSLELLENVRVFSSTQATFDYYYRAWSRHDLINSGDVSEVPHGTQVAVYDHGDLFTAQYNPTPGGPNPTFPIPMYRVMLDDGRTVFVAAINVFPNQ